jgi:plastocyanin
MKLPRLATLTRSVLLFGALALALGAAACGDDDDDDVAPTPTATRAAATTAAGSSPAAASPATGATTGSGAASGGAVAVADNSFSPASVTIPKGGKVTWTWNGSNPHSVVGKTADGKDVKSSTQESGRFEFTFDASGTFAYQCGVHGPSMAGTVVVQ